MKRITWSHLLSLVAFASAGNMLGMQQQKLSPKQIQAGIKSGKLAYKPVSPTHQKAQETTQSVLESSEKRQFVLSMSKLFDTTGYYAQAYTDVLEAYTIAATLDVASLLAKFDASFKNTMSQQEIDNLKKRVVIDAAAPYVPGKRISVPQAIVTNATQIFDEALKIYKPGVTYKPAASRFAQLKSFISWKKLSAATGALAVLVGSVFAYKTGMHKNLPKFNFQNLPFKNLFARA